MLKQVKFSNFKMFTNETIIDLNPTKSEILKEYNVEKGLLKGGLFFGSNASGKTTALHSISLLLDMLFKEYTFPDLNISLLSPKKDVYFEYTFVINNNEIIYNFSIRKGGIIIKEELFVNSDKVIDRIGTQANTTLLESKDSQKVSPKILFLRSLYFNTRFIEYPILFKWMKFLENSIYIDNTSYKLITFNQETFRETNLANYLEKNNTDDINEFFKEFSIPFKVIYEKIDTPLGSINNLLFTNLKTHLTIPMQLESYGNRLLLNLLPYILTIKKTGGMLLIDEFGGGFHNKLNELLVNYLFKKLKNTQTFIVTHETNLLKTSIVRPDQVYIIDFNGNGSFISKASEQSPRESQNLEKMYLAGVFGGIPLYDNNK